MPAALPLIAGAFLAAGTVATAVGVGLGVAFTIGATAITWAAVATITGVALLGVSMLTMKTPKPGSSGGQLDSKLDVRAPVPIAYGRTATGGFIGYQQSFGAKNAFLAMVAVLSAGPVEAIETHRANDSNVFYSGNPTYGLSVSTGVGDGSKLYKSKLRSRYQLGEAPAPQTITQASNLPLPGNPGKLSGLAHAITVLEWNQDAFPQGVPKNLWVLRGVKLYDPRKDSTYPGGSGGHRRDDPMSWEYSENPYLAALDWTLGRWWNRKKVYGIGARIEEVEVSAFVAGANIADANNWKIGGVVTTDDNKFAVLATILQTGGGVPVARGAQISCLVHAPKASAFTLRSSDVIGEAEIMNSTSWRDRSNTVVPTYREESQLWALVAGEQVSSQVYVDEDAGEKKIVEVEYPLVQQAAQAHQLATYDLCNSREFLTFTVNCRVRALNVRAGDAITVNIPEVAAPNQKCIVIGREFNPADLSVTLTLKSETDAKHPFALGQSQVAPPAPALDGYNPSAPGAPAATAWSVTGTQITKDGTSIPAIVINGEVDDPNTQDIVVDYRPVGDSVWKDWGTFARTTRQIELTAVTKETAYEVGIAYKTVRGVLSDRLVLSATAGEMRIDWGTVVTGTGKPADNADVTGDNTAKDTTNVAGRPASQIVAGIDLLPNIRTDIDKALADAQAQADRETAASTPPAMVSGLSWSSVLTDMGADITLTWSAVTDATTYQVELTEAGSNGVVFGAGSTTYKLAAAKRNTTYSARVRAMKGNVPGPWSNPASIDTGRDTIAPAAPSDLSVTPGYTWADIVVMAPGDADQARVQINILRVSDGVVIDYLVVNATANSRASARFAKLDRGTAYRAMAVAYDTSGNMSAPTAQVAFTTTAGIDVGDLTPGLSPIKTVSSLPDPANYTGASVVLFAGKLYRYANGAWTAAVDGGDLTTATVTGPAIAKNAIDTEKLVPGSVTTNIIANASVATEKLVQGSVTTAILNDGAITGPKLADRAVGEAKLVDKAVTVDKINDAAVTADKIRANSINANKLMAQSRPNSTFGLNMRIDTDGALRWNDGQITYLNADGAQEVRNIAAGGTYWHGWTSPLYVFFNTRTVPGILEIVIGAAALQDPDCIILAVWNNGTDLAAQAGVGTLINGDRILTGSVDAGVIRANTVLADSVRIGSGRTLAAVQDYALNAGNNRWYGDNYSAVNNKIVKINASGWESNAYTWELIKDASTMSGRLTTPGTFFGIVQDRRAGNYGVIDFAWHRSVDGNVYMYQSGTNVGSIGTADSVGASGVNFSVIYDGRTVRWLRNEFVHREVEVSAGRMFGGAVAIDAVGQFVDGVSFTSSADNSLARSDPAARINANTTTIEGGKITTGTIDALQIKSGAITSDKVAANSIAANKLVVATRPISTIGLNIRVRADQSGIDWDSGYITVINAGGGYDNWPVSGGSAGTPGAIILFVPGRNYLDQSTDNAFIANSEHIKIAKWEGGSDLKVYAGVSTVLNGDRIVTGTINADKIVAQSITGDQIRGNSISGDKIIANSITANRLSIASRPIYTVGLNFRVDTDGAVRWDAGQIRTSNQNGDLANYDIPAGVAYWQGGHMYFWFEPGRGIIDYNTDEANIRAENHIPLAFWRGGTDLVALSGVGTSINGDRIVTGSIDANRITAGTILSNFLKVSNTNQTLNLGDIHNVAVDPAARVNAVGTTIDGGKITTGSLTADQIKGATITGDKLVAGTISAAQIAAGAITATTLAVGNPDNVVPDADMRDPKWWGLTSALPNWSLRDQHDGWIWRRQLFIDGATEVRGVTSQFFPVEPGATYKIKGALWHDMGAASADFWMNVSLHIPGIQWLSLKTGQGNSDPGNPNAHTFTGSASEPFEFVYTNPPQGSVRQWQFRFDGHQSAGAHAEFMVSITRVSDATLIKDGSITTDKIVVGAITADKILAGTITGDKISTATSLPGTITVGNTGVSIETVRDRAQNTNVLTLNSGGYANLRVSGNSVRTSGEGGWTGDNFAWSSEYFRDGCRLSCKMPTVSVMAGIADYGQVTATNGVNYSHMNYVWHRSVNGNWYAGWNNWASQANLGQSANGVTFNDNTLFVITYDGSSVVWYADAIEMYRLDNQPADVTFYARIGLTDNSNCTSIRFEGYQDGKRVRNALNQLGVIGDDNVISRVEKTALNNAYNMIEREYRAAADASIDLIGKFGDVTYNQRVDADGRMYDLSSYLSDLRPLWNDYNQDTPVAGYVLRERFLALADRIKSLTVANGNYISARANDPATRVNEQQTLINPGKILIQGSTKLSDWKNGGDSTEIRGGAIAANSIKANQLTIGNRNISIIGCDFEYNPNDGRLYWNDGHVLYTDDNGNSASPHIDAGSTPWLGGSYNYVFWPKGGSYFFTGSDNWEQAQNKDANSVVMCTWRGGVNFVANYGGTIVNGDRITTGTINADRIKANTILASSVIIGGVSGANTVADAFKRADYNNVSGAGKPETYTVMARGNQTANLPAGYQHGLRGSNGQVFVDSINANLRSDAYARSYTVCWRFREDYWAIRTFDVYGNGPSLYDDYGIGAGGMANVLNSIGRGTPVVVYTSDEPRNNRLSAGLADAMYRCGASRTTFGSNSWSNWDSYVLIGSAGAGEGNGLEMFSPGGADSYVTASFSVVNGVIQTGGRTIKDARDLQFSTGGRVIEDLSTVQAGATVGAPAGTLVGGTPASTIEAQAANAAVNKWADTPGDQYRQEGNRLIKLQPTGWLSNAYTADNYVGACNIAGKLNPGTFMGISENRNWNNNDDYNQITYAWHWSVNGSYSVWKNGITVADFGSASTGGLPTVTLRIVYEGNAVKFYRNEMMMWSETTHANRQFWGAVAIDGIGTVVEQLKFTAGNDNSLANSDPAARVNAHTTTINGGKITTGSITANEIMAGTISADKIQANSIDASRLTINNRGMSMIGLTFEWNPGNGWIYWTDGYLYYQNQDGSVAQTYISSGNTGGAPAHRFFFWQEGTSYIQHTQDANAAVGSNRVMIGSWWGGDRLNINIGGTVINGSRISTGTITADRLNVGSLSAISANIGEVTAGVIRSASGGTNLNLNNGRLEFAASGFRLVEGAGIGPAGNMVLWYGPTWVGVGGETLANSRFALGTDGKVYYGAVEIGGSSSDNGVKLNGSVTAYTTSSTPVNSAMTSAAGKFRVSLSGTAGVIDNYGGGGNAIIQVIVSLGGVSVFQGSVVIPTDGNAPDYTGLTDSFNNIVNVGADPVFTVSTNKLGGGSAASGSFTLRYVVERVGN